MRVLIAAAVLLAPSSLFGWGCDGHRIIALLARAHLTPAASQAVDQLLREAPVDLPQGRFCPDPPGDLMAAAATWADDIRSRQKNGTWHYIDIPRTVVDPVAIAPWCPPIVPSAGGKDATGCAVDAISYFAKILADKTRPAADRAEALRYLIHFTGDIHQPLHAIDDSDQGGNCTAVRFEDDTNISNLHSIWDSRLLQTEMESGPAKTDIAFAAELDSRFAPLYAALASNLANDPEAWAWESNAVARTIVYGNLAPAVPAVPEGTNVACADRRQRVGALHITLGDAYIRQALPAVDQQLAKAGFRLALLLNSIL